VQVVRAAAAAAVSVAASVLVSLGACSSSTAPSADPVPCAGGFLGDASAAPTFDLQVITAQGSVVPVPDGGAVSLLTPPQGGEVVFAGVRATNLNACGAQLTGALRDEASGRVTLDMRTVNLIPTGDGWGVSGTTVDFVAANFANIPACPNQWSSTDVSGNPFHLEVTLTDSAGRVATRVIEVTPQCDGDPGCVCICKAGYLLGQACPTSVAGDGGDGGDAADAAD
jgi:hypothetical protein